MQLLPLVVLALFASAALVHAQETVDNSLVLVGNTMVGDVKVSFHGSVKDGQVSISQVNVLQTNVELSALWRDAPPCVDTPNLECLDDLTDAPFLRKQTVGFVFQAAKLEQSGERTLSGDLSGEMTTFISDYLLAKKEQAAINRTEQVLNVNRTLGDSETPAYRMKARMFMRLEGLPTEEEFARLMKASTEGYVGLPNVTMHLSAFGAPNEREVAAGLLPFSLTARALPLQASNPSNDLSQASGLILAPFWKWAIWRNLKVQPVGLSAPLKKICLEFALKALNIAGGGGGSGCLKWIWVQDPTRTGPAGLAFGKPNADTLWAQVGVRFQWLPIVYKFHPELKVLDNAAEEASLAGLHADATAVEVYFAQEFVPESANGGGYCSGCGGANTFVISTEKMVSANIDKTHLAHELGHTMGLSHPGVGSNASTGTLMCPSGYKRDNPRRNSKENGDNVNNPLFTFFLGSPLPAADCSNSAGCGSCYGVCLQNGVEVNC